MFNTTTITVDPGAYTGTYIIRNVNNTGAAGQRDFILLPGVNNYLLDISPGTAFQFNVDATGDVTSASAAQGVGKIRGSAETTSKGAPPGVATSPLARITAGSPAGE